MTVLVAGLLVYALQYVEDSGKVQVTEQFRRGPSWAGSEARPATERSTSGHPEELRGTGPSSTRRGREMPVPPKRVVPLEEIDANTRFGFMNAEDWSEFAILTSGRGCKFVEDAYQRIEPFMSCWCFILTENYEFFERLGCDVDLEIEGLNGPQARAAINRLLTENGYPSLDVYEFIPGGSLE